MFSSSYGNSGRQGPRTGNLAYVSNFISFSGQQILVFPREGEPVLFVGVENQRIESLRNGWISDTRCEAMTPVPQQACHYLNQIASSNSRIGISSLAIIPVAWYQQLQGQVNASEWVEAGDLVWEAASGAKRREVAMSRHAAKLGDRCGINLRDFIREGVTELDMRAEMDRVIIPEGGTENFNMMGLASMANGGEAPWGYVIPQTDRPIKNGDAVFAGDFPARSGVLEPDRSGSGAGRGGKMAGRRPSGGARGARRFFGASRAGEADGRNGHGDERRFRETRLRGMALRAGAPHGAGPHGLHDHPGIRGRP